MDKFVMTAEEITKDALLEMRDNGTAEIIENDLSRDSLKSLCEANNISFVCLGKNWQEATVECRFVGAVVLNQENFEVLKNHVDSGVMTLSICETKNGQSWFKHNAVNFDNLDDAKKEMSQWYRYDLAKSLSHSYLSEDESSTSGFYIDDELIASDSELSEGILSYSIDTTIYHIVAVLQE